MNDGERADTLFELSLIGGSIERRYRRLRPEVEALPWGTLNPQDRPESLVLAARRHWTLTAFQEHRTAAACGEAIRALVAARAPLDLIAMATQFPLDELVHVELCVRVANELGGATPILHDARRLVPRARTGLDPLLAAADLMVRYFCVGEAVSVPLLRGTWKAMTHPLLAGVLGRIVKDEAVHGELGWIFLDWALEILPASARRCLGRAAEETIAELTKSWAEIVQYRPAPIGVGASLGWLDPAPYLDLARQALITDVIAPLRERGIESGSSRVF